MRLIRVNAKFGGEARAMVRDFEWYRGGNGGGRSCIS